MSASQIGIDQLKAYVYLTARCQMPDLKGDYFYLVYEGQDFLSESLATWRPKDNVVTLLYSIDETLRRLAKWDLYPLPDQDYAGYWRTPLPNNIEIDCGDSKYLSRVMRALKERTSKEVIDDISPSSGETSKL